MELYAHTHRGDKSLYCRKDGKSSLSICWGWYSSYINSMFPLKIWIQFTETQVQLAVINSEQTDTYNQQTVHEKSLLRETLCFGPRVPILDTLLHFPFHKTNLCGGKLLVYVNICCANKTDGHYKFITSLSNSQFGGHMTKIRTGPVSIFGVNCPSAECWFGFNCRCCHNTTEQHHPNVTWMKWMRENAFYHFAHHHLCKWSANWCEYYTGSDKMAKI